MSALACSLVGMDATGGQLDLDPRLRAVLDLERTWRTSGVPKERVVRERLGLSPARYQQLLNRAIDVPEAVAYDAMLVRRLRRVRGVRRRARSVPRLGPRAARG
jgi:hypothetical protein